MDYIKELRKEIDAYKDLGVVYTHKEKVRHIRTFVERIYATDKEQFIREADYAIEAYNRDWLANHIVKTAELDFEASVDYNPIQTIREILKSTLRYILNTEITI